LQEIIEEQLQQQIDQRFLSPYGIKITADKNKKENKIQLESGRPWPSGKRITVAINSYSTASAAGRFKVLKRIAALKEVNTRDTKSNVRDILRDYIKKHSPISISVRQRVLIK